MSRELERAPTLLDAESVRRLIAGLLALVRVILTASALFVSQRALNAFDELLLPEFDRDAEIIAERLTSELARAAGLGIPLDQLAGVGFYFDAYLNEHPALVYLGVGDATGRLVASVGPAVDELDQLTAGTLTLTGEQRSATVTDTLARRTTMLVEASDAASSGGEAYAIVHVGMDRRYAERQIADIRWDIVVVLVVSLLVTFELLVFVIDRTMTTPLRLIDRAISAAVQGDWTGSGADPSTRDEVGGLWGAMDETGRRIHDRLGGLDATLARLQTVPADLARRVEDLRGRLRWRLATAADRPVESRANARFTLVLFVFAEELSRSFLPLYAQSIYRPAAELGSFGQALESMGLAFLLSPELVVGLPIMVFMGVIAIATPFGASLTARYLQDPASETRRERSRTSPPRLTSQLRAFANRRFLALVVLAAIPAKMALTGFLFYAAPLYLSGLDVSQPTIGRMIMLYGLLMLVGTQIGARLHGGAWLGLLLISGGGLLTALALQLPWALAPELGMGLAIAVFGFAQGLAAAPMLAVLPDLCPEESRRFGATGMAALLRLAERVGSVLGPMLAAALVLRLGYASAIGVIGAVSAVSAVLLLLLMLVSTGGGMTNRSSSSGGNE